MAVKERKSQPTSSNINTNNNTNNVHVNVKVEQPKKRTYKKKPKNNWIKKILVGGLITLAVSLIGYYLQQDSQTSAERNSTSITPNGQALQGQNQN